MREFQNTRNPILPLEYHVPDGEAHVMPDGRLYLYGSFDDQENDWCSEKYHVVSTADMENWTIHEMALNGKDIPWLNNPDAPKYRGLDWSRPTPFMRKMLEDDGETPYTAHTTNLVPFYIVGANVKLRDGKLCDITPTMLDLMGLQKPKDMTGETLIES